VKLRNILSCRLGHEVANETPCLTCAGVKRCKECYTDSEVEIRLMEDGRRALVFTTWQVFAEGATPFQSKFPKWTNENGETFVLLRQPGGLKVVFNSAHEEALTTS